MTREYLDKTAAQDALIQAGKAAPDPEYMDRWSARNHLALADGLGIEYGFKNGRIVRQRVASLH